MRVFLKKCGLFFLGACFFSLFINILQLTFSVYMLSIYDNVLPSASLPTLYSVTILAILALSTWGFLDFCRSRLLVRAGVKLDALLSRKILSSMLQELSRIDSTHYKEGLSDIITLRNYLGGSSIFAFFDLPWVFIYLGIIYLIHPLLGLTATFGAFVILLVGIMQVRCTQQNLDEAKELNMLGQHWCATIMRNAQEVQVLGMTGTTASGYKQINNKELQVNEVIGRLTHSFSAFSQGFSPLMQVIIYGVGATLVLKNESGPGVIIAASIIMGQALAPIRNGMEAWRQTAGAKRAYNNLDHLLDKARHRSAQMPIMPIQGGLKLNNVKLDIGTKTILHSVNFSLEPGELMGVIGHNGAGKTSLCRLILGIWQPTQGEALIDGMNVYHIDKNTLGSFVGYLPQEVELFDGTVKTNIARLGELDQNLVISAAKQAYAHEAILRYGKGYDTEIGEAGMILSGGQRQRIGLARALYGNPKLILLDEPNSNLDEAGEGALTMALQGLKQRKTTTIMITHKKSLLAQADKILVINNGEQILFGKTADVLQQMAGVTICSHQ